MATIRWPEGRQVRGSIGGTTYARNRFGEYARPRTVPVNPNSDRQVIARTFLRNLAIAWNSVLTDNERETWELYGDNVNWHNAFGDSVHLTGLNHFIRSNSARLQTSLPLRTTAPGTFEIAEAPQNLAATWNADAQTLIVAFDTSELWANETNGRLLVYQGIEKNASTRFFAGPWSYLGAVSGSPTPPTSPATFALVTPIHAGNKSWMYARVLRANARLSEPVQLSGLAVSVAPYPVSARFDPAVDECRVTFNTNLKTLTTLTPAAYSLRYNQNLRINPSVGGALNTVLTAKTFTLWGPQAGANRMIYDASPPELVSLVGDIPVLPFQIDYTVGPF